mmetsp:Transcript_1356/g.1833  ORF Transcript_1356/g.1833 Transcript_1356/m.1833 type:complete len:298 (-) Transcript_1356:957-1850(-)
MPRLLWYESPLETPSLDELSSKDPTDPVESLPVRELKEALVPEPLLSPPPSTFSKSKKELRRAAAAAADFFDVESPALEPVDSAKEARLSLPPLSLTLSTEPTDFTDPVAEPRRTAGFLGSGSGGCSWVCSVSESIEFRRSTTVGSSFSDAFFLPNLLETLLLANPFVDMLVLPVPPDSISEGSAPASFPESAGPAVMAALCSSSNTSNSNSAIGISGSSPSPNKDTIFSAFCDFLLLCFCTRGGITRFTATSVPRYSASSTRPKVPRPIISGGSSNSSSSGKTAQTESACLRLSST